MQKVKATKEDLEKLIKEEEKKIDFFFDRIQEGTDKETNEKMLFYCQERLKVYLDLLCRV